MEDKENIPINIIDSFNKKNTNDITMKKSFTNYKSESKQSSNNLYKRSTFSRLLEDAKNEIIEEIDEEVAFQSHIDEIVNVACEWVREENDYKIASELNVKYKYEYESDRANRLNAQSKDERTAIEIAIEERNRLLDYEKHIKSIEEKDYYYSQQLLQSEEELKELCDQDELVAKQIELQLQDELIVEDIYKKEYHEYNQYVKDDLLLQEADEKVALSALKEMESSYYKQMKDDELYALQLQQQIDETESIKQKEIEENDFLLSQKLHVNTLREDYCNKKRLEWLSSDDYQSFSDIKSIKQMWLNTKTDIENVSNGICITVILPHLKSLKVYIKNYKRVCITATRMKSANDIDSDSNMSLYDAEFLIDGSNIKIKQSDINYEYNSETGLLYVFIDHVKVNQWNTDKSDMKSLINKMKNSFKRLIKK